MVNSVIEVNNSLQPDNSFHHAFALNLIYNQIESVYDANTMLLTSNVAITVVDGDIFYRN